MHYVPRAVQLLDKPYIAAVNGAAVGAGMDMASMADIRIASEHAKFAMSYVKVGLVPGDGGCYFLPRIVGIAKALELIWTGDFIDAQEALRIGYVSKVVPGDELMATATAFARRLAGGAGGGDAAREAAGVSRPRRELARGVREGRPGDGDRADDGGRARGAAGVRGERGRRSSWGGRGGG